MDIGTDLKAVPRDPRIKITGRRCTTCPRNAPIAFCILFRLPTLPPFEFVICDACILRIVQTMHSRSDAVITVDADQARIHLA